MFGKREPPVTLGGTMSNQGLLLYIRPREPVRQLAYRLEGEPAFVDVPPPSGLRSEDGTFVMGAATVPLTMHSAPTQVDVRYVEASGLLRETSVPFDPRAQIVASAKANLAVIEASWITFRSDPNGVTHVYFTTLLSYKYVLHRIHYSVDSDALDRTVAFVPSDRIDHLEKDQLYISLPYAPSFVAVKVMYLDETASEIHRFSPGR